MQSSTSKSHYWRGFRAGLPFTLVIAPFALLFGVVATEAGLNILETMGFSVIVIAGAAQFTAVQLMTEQAPTFVVILSALAVNLRMAMYSASLTPHIGALPLWQRAVVAYFTVDQSYAVSIAAYEQNPAWRPREKLAFFMGSITPIVPVWYAGTLLGAVIGTSIPQEFALDFAIPITFLALIAPMLKTGAHLVAALVSVTLSLVFAWMPLNMGLLIAGLGGMMAGAEVERRMTTRTSLTGAEK